MEVYPLEGNLAVRQMFISVGNWAPVFLQGKLSGEGSSRLSALGSASSVNSKCPYVSRICFLLVFFPLIIENNKEK